MRGLKPLSAQPFELLNNVALPTSAWIETLTYSLYLSLYIVALPTSAWIETVIISITMFMHNVALPTSAWIETLCRIFWVCL